MEESKLLKSKILEEEAEEFLLGLAAEVGHS